MKLLSHLWLVTLCASRYSVTYAETAMQSEWCWLECSGGSSKLFSGCWSQANPWQEAAFLLLTFQTKQCKWMLVEQVTAPKRNLCCLTLLPPLNCQQYSIRFSIHITCIWCRYQTLLKSAPTAVGIQDDWTKESSHSVSAGQESVVGAISCPLEQLCPFTQKANKKHFTSVTYTHKFVFTNISSARAVELLTTLHRKMGFCSAKARRQYCEIINCLSRGK